MQKFNYHSHTYRCGHADEEVLDEEYVLEYIKMGFEKIAFTDHCPEKNEIDTRQKVRMKYHQKEEYLGNIKKLKEKYANKIEIFSGYEVEYLPGEEENIKELKEESDKIVLGQHFIYDDNKELKILGEHLYTDEDLLKYAHYIEKAMELKIPDIIAHPDFFMKKSRKSFGEAESVVAKIICQSAEKYNIPLEINLNNIFNNTYYEGKIRINNDSIEKQKEKLENVAYPCRKFWEIATNYDIKVVYGIDTHHKGEISLWHQLVELANEIIGKETIKKLQFIEE